MRRRCGRGTRRRGPASGWWPPSPATTVCRASATGAPPAARLAPASLAAAGPAHSRVASLAAGLCLWVNLAERRSVWTQFIQLTQGASFGPVCSFSVAALLMSESSAVLASAGRSSRALGPAVST